MSWRHSAISTRVSTSDKDSAAWNTLNYCSHSQVCTPALNILEDMGVLQELVDNNEAHFADSGGFVSPSGLAYIGEQHIP